MNTYLDCLQAVSAYPVPQAALRTIAARVGLELDAEPSPSGLSGKTYNLAVAGVLMWLSEAPDVTQGGQSYSFTDAQRLQLRQRAHAIADAFGDDTAALLKSAYGYKGSRL